MTRVKRVFAGFSSQTLYIMLLHESLSKQISVSFYEVYNRLGYGFLEKVYQNALYFELKDRGFEVIAQRRCTVFYKGKEVGEYFSDITINGIIILELKACKKLNKKHELQLQNYLKASSIELGFLLNFGHKPEFRRIVFQTITTLKYIQNF